MSSTHALVLLTVVLAAGVVLVLAVALIEVRRGLTRISEGLATLAAALQGVESGVGGDDLLREPDVGAGQRIHRVDYHLLRDAAHFGDAALERAEFIIVGLDGVIDHWSCSLSRIGR